jgi:diguanylate cyclase (GGDEF)-like protein
MNILTKLGQRLGNPLNWPPGDKAFLVFLLSAIIQMEYLGWILLVTQDADMARFVDMESVHTLFPLALSVLASSCLLSLAWLFLRKVHPASVVHDYSCNLYYACSLCVFSYLSGTMTMATGVVLAGAPILGFILFRPGPVFWSLGAALVLLTVGSLGAVYGWWPYAPVMSIPLGHNSQLAAFWFISMGLFTLPHLVVITFLSWYVLAGWRNREEATRLLSVTDPLTGIPNRRAILAVLERERRHTRATGHALSVVMVDLDHFKSLNDGLGHAAGDRALQETAVRLQQGLRQNDHIGRIGGEEFLMILPGTDSRGAMLLAERCRHAVEAEPVTLENGEPVQLTASLGVFSLLPGKRTTVDDMLALADQALYRAKERGRNRVELAGPADPE